MATMQNSSMILSPVTSFSRGTRSNVLVHSKYVAVSLKRNVGLGVRCMGQGENDEKSPPPVTTPLESPLSPLLPKVAHIPVKAKTGFSDVFAFSGPAPERINGRLAMIGFVAAMAIEVSNGQDVFAQIANGGVPWFLGTSALLSVASVIPLFKGVDVKSKSDGLFTSDAELWNGRFAMLGLVALAFTEYVKGGALV